jgi:hypothetical protein
VLTVPWLVTCRATWELGPTRPLARAYLNEAAAHHDSSFVLATTKQRNSKPALQHQPSDIRPTRVDSLLTTSNIRLQHGRRRRSTGQDCRSRWRDKPPQTTAARAGVIPSTTLQRPDSAIPWKSPTVQQQPMGSLSAAQRPRSRWLWRVVPEPHPSERDNRRDPTSYWPSHTTATAAGPTESPREEQAGTTFQYTRCQQGTSD